MKRKTLLVLITEAQVPNYDAAGRGKIDFIGRRKDFQTGQWVSKGSEPIEVPARAEYIKALRAGELLPANDYTRGFAK